MNIDELEKLARAAHDPGFPWVDRDAMIGGLFAKGEIDYIAAANPAAILELIENYRDLVGQVAYLCKAPTQPSPAESDTELSRAIEHDLEEIRESLDDLTITNLSQVATGIRDLKEKMSSPTESDNEAVRNAALEEAAVACSNTRLMNIDSYCGGTASMCADRIRALKTTSVSEVSQTAQLSGNSGELPEPPGEST